VPSAVVVGAGAFGAATALALARSGWSVTLVDRYPPGHVRAASGGESRLIRFSHGSDAWYTRSAWRSRDAWCALEAEAGEELLAPVGVAWFARREDGWERDSEGVLRGEGIPVERLDVDAARALFPSMGGDDLAFVLWEPQAGVLHARRATQALARLAQEAGARFRGGAARPDGRSVLIDGKRLDADAVVWACGGWLPALFPDLVRARVTKQDVFFFGGELGWRTPPVPGWVDYDGAFYGSGDLDGRGVKVSPDVEGPEFDPDRGERVASADGEAAARAYLERRFPDLAGAPLVGTRTCQYTITADSNFLLAPHPEHTGVWLAGGDSGHGFKHAPVVGEHLAALVSGAASPDPRFGLGDRAPGRSLRTAGR
jgi:glycine/D-amino acid oxidase-like deaminating enzyme